ncbi:MAG: ABC transporter permease [Actinobacteria bacterium]|nr:MAG: ABC transporter permease [Actinomycetota bacterium]
MGGGARPGDDGRDARGARGLSETVRQLPEEQLPVSPSTLERYRILQKAGGLVAPLLTVVLAFLISGVVVLLTTGSVVDTAKTYKGIFDGTGLDWFFHVGSYQIGVPFTSARVWFPWNTNDISSQAAANLEQTLLLWTALVLVGLAVAFAFRCGLFNIGGQGQYLAGSIAAVLVATELPHVVDLPGVLLLLVSVLGGMLAGAALAGIAGILKGTVGAHEVITTIMLNWIVIWVGSYLFDVGGPLQTKAAGAAGAVPASTDIPDKAQIHVFWGDPLFQGLDVGFFVAIASLVVYYLTLNRTTLGYEVRAVGHNPEAARYGGIGVARNYFLAMAIAGTFAGLAGALDLLGWKFRDDITDIQSSSIGFIGIAVALLGRNTAIGVGLAALLFAALQTGTASRSLDPSIFPPELASSLAVIIQGLVVLFVGADVIILLALGWLRRRRPQKAATAT